MESRVCIDDIQAAAASIHVHRTPVLTCTALSAMCSQNSGTTVTLLLKCELFQKTGSFKIRGATNAVNRLSESEAAKGVVTHSSGNHAQALALAARERGIPATVVMPSNAASVKKAAVKGYGATVIESEPTQDAREAAAQKVVDQTGATFIHPYNNPRVIAGQGTTLLELIAQTDEQGTPLDAVIIPVGGGGMLSGCSVASKALKPHVKVFAAEPELVNDCARSFATQKRETNVVGTQSVADGLLTNVGQLAFPLILEHVDQVFTVTETQIVHAMELVWSRAKLCIEPSAAVGVAVALYNSQFHNTVRQMGLKQIGVILGGGNVDHTVAVELFKRHKALSNAHLIFTE